MGGKPLDNATIVRLKQAEKVLGYPLTIVQGIGGAAASGNTHLEGRAADLAPYDWQNKLRVLKDLGFIGWYRPAIAGLWPAHIHVVLIFDGRDNHRGINETAWRQIGLFDRGLDGLVSMAKDTLHPYRPSPLRGFSMEDYRKSFDVPEPKPKFATIEVVTFNPWVGNKNLRGNLRQMLEDTGRPVAVALQEMKGDGLKLAGYTRVQASREFHPHQDARSNVLLVRNKGVKILNEGIIDIADYDETGWNWGPGDGPRDVHHPPKIFPYARIETEGREWVVLAGHRVVAGFGINKAEWRAEDRALEDFFDTRGRVTTVAAMDWNDSPADREVLGVAHLAKRVGAELEIIGIDGGMIRGADRTHAHKLDEGYGSDGHRPVVITVKKEIR
jgi:hypothetical protein